MGYAYTSVSKIRGDFFFASGCIKYTDGAKRLSTHIRVILIIIGIYSEIKSDFYGVIPLLRKLLCIIIFFFYCSALRLIANHTCLSRGRVCVSR